MLPIDAHQLYLAERVHHNDSRHPADAVIGQLSDALAQFWVLVTRPGRTRRAHRAAQHRAA